MNNDDFKIYIEDVGDISVGIQPMLYFEARLNGFLTEELDKKQFQKDLVDLFCKYFEPETNFAIWNSDDEKAEEEWCKKMEKEGLPY